MDTLNQNLIKDLFVIGCFTALPWSDYSRIKKENIIANTIDIFTHKTKERIVIPTLSNR